MLEVEIPTDNETKKLLRKMCEDFIKFLEEARKFSFSVPDFKQVSKDVFEYTHRDTGTHYIIDFSIRGYVHVRVKNTSVEPRLLSPLIGIKATPPIEPNDRLIVEFFNDVGTNAIKLSTIGIVTNVQ